MKRIDDKDIIFTPFSSKNVEPTSVDLIKDIDYKKFTKIVDISKRYVLS